MHRHRALSGAMLGLGLAGCGGRSPAAPAPAGPVSFASADPRRCLVPMNSPAAVPELVQACAETFVRSQGYGPVRALRDTTLLVREPFEVGTWSLLADQRRYSVEARAALTDCDASGCIVFFRRFVRSQGCLAVVMGRGYDRVQFGRPAEAELMRRFPQTRCF